MKKMKDSGIEWIGEIPEEWEVSRIKNYLKRNEPRNPGDKIVLSLYRDLGIVPKDSRDDNHNVTSLDTSNYKYVCIGDFVINKMKAWQGSVAVSDYEGIVSPAYYVYNFTDSTFVKKYFHYLLRNCYKDEFRRLSGGIREGQWDLSSENFDTTLVIIPNKISQTAISAYLDRQCTHIDNIIEKTKTSIEEYKKLKQAVITQAVTKGIRSKREMKDSGIEWIGEIPKSFSTRKLKTFCDVISKGTTPKEMETAFSEKFSIRFIKSENIINNNLSEVPMFTISEETHLTLLQRSILNERDILFVIAGASIGKCAIMNKILLPANTNQATCFIRVKSSLFEYIKYIWYVLQTDIMKTYISLFSVQSAQPNISMEDLGNFVISLPNDKTEIKDIISYLDKKCTEIDAIITKKQQFLTEMENYKKSLIFECVTGKREVSV